MILPYGLKGQIIGSFRQVEVELSALTVGEFVGDGGWRLLCAEGVFIGWDERMSRGVFIKGGEYDFCPFDEKVSVHFGYKIYLIKLNLII